MTDLMTIEEVAELVRVPPQTLRYWRHLDRGPHSFRLGRRVMYKRADVEQWVQQQYESTAAGVGG